MIKKNLAFLALALSCFTAFGAVPPAEKLLPSDTLFMLSAPSATKLQSVFDASPQGQLWRDPAMRPFREDFNRRFSTNFVESFEKELGIKIADYKELAQGQVTFAVTQNGWDGISDEKLGLILLIDAGTKSDQLKKNLEALKKRWTETGKQIKTEKIQNFEFTTITTTDEEMGKSLEKIFPGREQPAGETNKIEITVGQAESLLLVANSSKVIEKILSRLSGGLVPGLAEEANYENNHNAHFRNAHLFAWANPKPLFDSWKAAPSTGEDDGMTPKPDKILSAIGLNGLKSVAFAYTDSPEGGSAKFVLGVPESTRQGLLKMLIPETKDSAPLPYFPADLAKFNRWRINLQKTFGAIETMVTEMSPAAAGVFKLVLDSAGKDQDPNFDLRKELIGNLGDDLITISKPARSGSLEDVSSPPTLYMIGSPNAEKLAHSLKVALSSLGQDTFKEREFLGRKVFTLTMPGGALGGTTAKALHFSSTAGYFASSTDVAMLEEFLRNADFKGKPLSETAGLNEAIQKVGGSGTGFLGYENQRENTRTVFEALKKNPELAQTLFGLGALNSDEGEGEESKIKQWADFTLLPSFDSIAKYFHFSVHTGTADANGITFNAFAPTPPELKK